MKTRETVASRAKWLLHHAASRLGAVDPLGDVGDVIDESMAVPFDEPQRETPLSTNFSEQTPEHLNFVMRALGRGVTGADRIQSASSAIHRVVGSQFGRSAQHWLDQRLEPIRGRDTGRSATWGAAFGSAYDRSGLTESFLHCEWGPGLMDGLPAPLYRLVRLALDSLPNLRPAISTIRCGRTAGSQQVSFEVTGPLQLTALKPLMDQLGLGHRHAGLMSAVAFVLGARFVLPPESAMLTLRPARSGVELRLDVNLDSIPDLPAQVMALMRLQMTERPKSIQGLDRWLMALTPDGYPGPGTLSVLSVWVRADLAARIALFLRPAVLDPELGQNPPLRAEPSQNTPSVPRVRPASEPVSAAAEWSSSAWVP